MIASTAFENHVFPVRMRNNMLIVMPMLWMPLAIFALHSAKCKIEIVNWIVDDRIQEMILSW